MNFALEPGPNGTTVMSWDKPTTIFNEVWFSINTPYGSIINLPKFGLNLSDIKKLTDDKPALIQGRVEKCLQWIIDIGLGVSMEVSVLKSDAVVGRVDINAKVTESDGTVIDVDTFRTVGGPADDFSI